MDPASRCGCTLVAASLALVLLALVVIGTVSAIALHSYLVDRVDSQLMRHRRGRSR